MNTIFEGTGVALVTPFVGDKIDYDATKKIIENIIPGGAKAVAILATTGEGVTVSNAERRDFIKFCKEVIRGRVKLIVGTGNNNFQACLKNTRVAKQLGADAVLVVTPYYNKTTQNGIVKYYEELAKVKIPIIMYNVPSRTGLMIELDTIEKIALENEYVVAIKESTTDINRIIKLCKICKNKLAVYSGEDGLNFLFYCLGAQGSISVTANILPSLVQKVFSLVKQNDLCGALEYQTKLDPLNEALFCETNPIPIKYFMSLCGLMHEDVRMPLVPLSDKNKTKLQVLHSHYFK